MTQIEDTFLLFDQLQVITNYSKLSFLRKCIRQREICTV